MLNNKHKLLELKTSKLIDSLFVGNYKTKHKGRGIEFADFKEYDYGDDIKNIDFVKSDKEGKILVKLFEEERELSIYFVIDINISFSDNYISNNKKQDILLEIIYLAGLSAIKSGDKVGSLFTFENKKELFIAKKGKQNFINIVNGINNILDIHTDESLIGIIKKIFTKNSKSKKINTIKYFNNLKIKNSLVFYLTDSLSIQSKDLKILASKNDLIFCNIFNSFENNLIGDGIIGIENLGINIDLKDKKKVEKYKTLRNEKILNINRNIVKYGGKYLLLDESKDIYKEFYKLFKR